MYRCDQTSSYADLISKQTLSDSSRLGIIIDKENSYALLQKRKQKSREFSNSNQQKENDKMQKGLLKSASLQQFYKTHSADKQSYSYQQKNINQFKDIKNSNQQLQAYNSYKQRHVQSKQQQSEQKQQELIQTYLEKYKSGGSQEYKRLSDKLQNLEKKINQLKESFEGDSINKQSERKQQSLTTKLFQQKSKISNIPQVDKQKETNQLYNIYSQIQQFKNYLSNSQLLQQNTEKKKLKIQDFVTQMKSTYKSSKQQKKASISQQIYQINQSDRSGIEKKQNIIMKQTITQPDMTFLYYISTVLQSFNNPQPTQYDEYVRDHFSQTYQGLIYSNSLELDLPEEKIVNLPRANNLKTLVFDLDETLVHCNESTSIQGDVILPIIFPTGEKVQASINIRPFAQNILQLLSKHFEIIIFTASHSSYANVVIDYLDPRKQWISHRFYRESCLQSDEGAYIKDLRVLGNRKLCNVLLIDNAAYSYGRQIDNGVPILSYYDDQNDQELQLLCDYLLQFRYVKDVRELNSKLLKFRNYLTLENINDVLNLYN